MGGGDFEYDKHLRTPWSARAHPQRNDLLGLGFWIFDCCFSPVGGGLVSCPSTGSPGERRVDARVRRNAATPPIHSQRRSMRTHGWETRHAMRAGRYRRRRRSPTYLRTGSPVGQTRRERSFWVVAGVLSFRQPVNVASVTRHMYNGGPLRPPTRSRTRETRGTQHGMESVRYGQQGPHPRLFSVGEQATCRTTGGGHGGLRAQTKKGTSKRRLFEAFSQKKRCDQSIPWS